ncbi:uncharacterized protein LOC129773314 [Toxorhynchites rutilus septentrionalis]|uniref:uncharacterized protein LOC129773314 n=1 Tax=Toxorhynchites rutilus septentrionalis TaxID=329112 RepID=UPI00247A3450|nr:uncharacterized protein LOC129773314 [Toxorhynchites rutilus septentrionalis]
METSTLERISSICDLGVMIDSKLRFIEHVDIMTAKAFSVLGFIRRHANEFTDDYVLKTLYCSLVRSILEYAAPVWSPFYVTHTLMIERMQKKFLRYALRRLPWNGPINLPPYSDRCRLIGLEPLSTRRVTMQRMFDIIQGGKLTALRSGTVWNHRIGLKETNSSTTCSTIFEVPPRSGVE